MRSTSLPIKYLLIDIDNCLVRYDDNYVPYVTDVIVDAVLQLDEKARRVFNGDRDLVRKLADEFYLKYGQSVLGFAEEYHFPISDLCDLYHDQLDPDKCVNPNDNDMARLRRFKEWILGSVRMGRIENYVAFTQSTKSWAEKILFDKCELYGIFNNQNIITSEQYDHAFKHRDRRPYDVAMARMQATPDECVIIDDSKSVLRFAFNTIGMKTCLITHGNKIAEQDRGYLSGSADHIGNAPIALTALVR